MVGDPPAPRRLMLSPSRAVDFKTCPLLYRLRAIDGRPEPPSRAAVRGTLVHAVLEQLFGEPAADRTVQQAVGSIGAVWQRLSGSAPELASLLDEHEVIPWLGEAAQLVRAYFTLEDPGGFDAESCESAVEVVLHCDGGHDVPLKGFIDRIDVAGTGELRIVDYKTGRSPSEHSETRALYQLKFYALMVYRLRGIVPEQLKLIYLADSRCLTYRPTEDELVAFERGVVALWRAITSAVRNADFPARRSSACQWCAHQSVCPEFGGTPPPYPGRGHPDH